MDGLLVDLRDNVLITVYFDFTYSGLYRCIVFFLLIVSLLHYLAIQPSRLQVCFNKISCQMLSDFQNSFTDRSNSKRHIQPHIKRVAAQPCEILMPENWRRSEMYIVIFSNYIKWLSLA